MRLSVHHVAADAALGPLIQGQLQPGGSSATTMPGTHHSETSGRGACGSPGRSPYRWRSQPVVCGREAAAAFGFTTRLAERMESDLAPRVIAT